MTKNIYHFNKNHTDGDISMKKILGGKGAHLAGMSKLGINVPAGFTISTHECLDYLKNGCISENTKKNIFEAVKTLEKQTGKFFGKSEKLLLVSVRSGAAISMPGMMDTVLNLGLNSNIVDELIKNNPANESFFLDSYRRLIQMYGSVVLGVPHRKFDTILNDIKNENNYQFDNQIDSENIKYIIEYYLSIIKNYIDLDLFFDPYHQLLTAIEAVFKSWNTDRAVLYRELNNIDSRIGTAVNIQSMVFGNANDNSGSGVLFSRNPSTGENVIYGEYLNNCQGEDVVAGVRNPFSISKSPQETNSLEEKFPNIYIELCQIAKRLEKINKNVQDIEFTIESGELFILQTRNAKRTASATLRSISDMLEEGLISEEDAILNIDPNIFDKLLYASIDDLSKYNVLATGLAASPGCVSGEVCFSVEKCIEMVKEKSDRNVILVRNETTPEDLAAMNVAKGILTANGGSTSHAAVVARGMGKPCVTACPIEIDYDSLSFKVQKQTVKEGDIITIDGSTGNLILGHVNTVNNEIGSSFKKIIDLGKKYSKVSVYSNSDNINDINNSISFEASNIGLCRTEHMFFENHKINSFRKLILIDDSNDKSEILNEIFEIQKKDFIDIFSLLTKESSINIRLLDPPLHEFLPHDKESVKSFVEINSLDYESMSYKIKTLKESNPMLGNRGIRLGMLRPEIYDIQIKSILAACEHISKANTVPSIEIMLPFVSSEAELERLSVKIRRECELFKLNYKDFRYKIGAMIELPIACIIADKLAKHVDYFSFGTNDLTQTTLGISRDDCTNMISSYIHERIYKFDPFIELDQDSVGYLIKMAIEKGRSVKSELKVGICGEHGASREAIKFAIANNVNYVSCSPFRIPKATIIAAQESINFKF